MELYYTPKARNDLLQIKESIIEKFDDEIWRAEFTKKYGGNVFYLFSCKQGDKKIIVNTEVIDEIREEINRLKS